MTDYTDLIARLRVNADECARHYMIGDADHMREAAAAIAALQAEVARLRGQMTGARGDEG